MLFNPKWLKDIPNYMRPDKEIIKKLEKLRIEFNVPHDVLAMRIMCSKATTKKVQKYFLEEYRWQTPNASERELWLMVLSSRVETHKNYILSGLSVGNITPKEAECKLNKLMEIIKRYHEIIKEFETFEELCDYILQLDETIIGKSYSYENFFDVGNMIDKILEE